VKHIYTNRSGAKCWLDIYHWGAGLAVNGPIRDNGQNILQYSFVTGSSSSSRYRHIIIYHWVTGLAVTGPIRDNGQNVLQYSFVTGSSSSSRYRHILFLIAFLEKAIIRSVKLYCALYDALLLLLLLPLLTIIIIL